MLGQALQKILPDAYYINSSDYELTNQDAVKKMYYELSPDTVIHCAALVGGIRDNMQRPESYFSENILMDTLMIRFALANQVPRFIGILSTCAYPDVSLVYPMTENMLHAGPPAESNLAYGYAKRAMAVHIDACNQQYGTSYQYLIPCNLYSGKHIKDATRAHFLDTLIVKIRYAVKNRIDHIDLLGTGIAKRQFMTAGDMARVIKRVVEDEITESFNVCPDENLSIKEITWKALSACGATHLSVNWDGVSPDGQLNKAASNARMREILPDFEFTPLMEGIKEAYQK